MGHCHFMAWHTLRDALKMTGRSRSQLYRDMRAGLVSYRTGRDGRREFETSELIRAYGELKQNETPERHSEGHAENPHDQQTERILRELNELKQCLTLMLEDKQAQDMDRRRQEAEREQLQNEIAQLRQALELEKKRGFWSRLFGR
ncbi:entry exclusion protein 1 [Escherichia coli]|uniref:entry exclusion protein 1 n=1 Tax=Escherichia coli TaxID=562 RepID=UPI001B9DB601|nr:entry exclusion protein 1 [Escherichia coli]HBN2783984.1 entry exclusion protein 1 [Escherichia coli O25b:H4-ST131]EIT4474091.1 entry exclusion protein 1 [Escherichia coli]HBC1032611.1 entry exclusion protein 1 [Escherichia coli]HBC6563346.1 entry exclusion protein 1 [Escherichia coli]HBE7527548.1 entry exclusion protein 1 [Escherichia coli]